MGAGPPQTAPAAQPAAAAVNLVWGQDDTSMVRLMSVAVLSGPCAGPVQCPSVDSRALQLRLALEGAHCGAGSLRRRRAGRSCQSMRATLPVPAPRRSRSCRRSRSTWHTRCGPVCHAALRRSRTHTWCRQADCCGLCGRAGTRRACRQACRRACRRACLGGRAVYLARCYDVASGVGVCLYC